LICSYAFGYAQDGAASTGINLQLVWAGPKSSQLSKPGSGGLGEGGRGGLRKQSKLTTAHSGRALQSLINRSGGLINELFNHSVFERMKANHREPCLVAKPMTNLGKQACELIELLVHRYAKGLKSSGRRMMARLPASAVPTQNLFNKLCKRKRGLKDRCLSEARLLDTVKNSSRYFTRMALFAKPAQAVLELRLRRGLKPLPGRQPRSKIHTHIEWTVPHEAKAPIGLVKLRRGDPQVRKQPMNKRLLALHEH
jgi:hypothetical protein